jgi:hypothetical protein
MANPEVSIDYAVVGEMANTFAQSADTLGNVGNMVGAAASLLAVTGFGGIIGLAAQAMLLAVQGNASAISAHCNELSSDLNAAIQALQNGDTTGAQRFAQ